MGPQPRGERDYIACVHKGLVVLVGRNSIVALNLADGSNAWGGRTIPVPAGAAVCGHGCYADGQYFVPLGPTAGPPYTGEGGGGAVLAVDLESGKVLAIVKSPHAQCRATWFAIAAMCFDKGWTVWNCIARLRPQGRSGPSLAANPDDVEALTLRGEVLLEAGKAAAAAADFRRAWRAGEEFGVARPRRELLRDTLLTGLSDDFAAQQAMTGEVEPLLDDAGQRLTYLRAMATGLHRAGQWRQAVECYLKLVDLEEAKPSLERIEPAQFAAAAAGSKPGWACFAAKAARRRPPNSIVSWTVACERS